MTDWWRRAILISIGVLPFLLVAQVIVAQQLTRDDVGDAQESLDDVEANQEGNELLIRDLRIALAEADAKIEALSEQLRSAGLEPVVQPRTVVRTTTTTRPSSTTTTTSSPPPSSSTTTTQPQPTCTTLPLTRRCV